MNNENGTSKKTIDFIRGILIIPITLLVALVILIILCFIFYFILGPFIESDYSFYVLAAFIASITAISWLGVSQVMAPKYKKETLWLSYFCGLAVVIYLMTFEFHNNIWMFVALASSGLTGLLYCLYYQFKNNSDKDKASLFKSLDENIS